MRLSEWRVHAPRKDAASPKIAAVVDPVLASLGAGADPHCWVAWGDDPASRHTILVPVDPGLVSCFVRLIPGEGPRATAKLIRWNRVTIGELAVEAQGGRRLLSFQIEQQVLRGVDAEADEIASFALRVIAAIDGRPLPPVAEQPSRRARGGSTRAATPGKGTTRALVATTPSGKATRTAGSKPAPSSGSR